MAERGQRPKNAGIADQHVEPSETLVQREAEPVDALVVLEVEGYEGGRAAQGLDRVVELLESADRARERDDMGAGLRQRERGGVADAARGAGDERDTVGEGKRHRYSLVTLASLRPSSADKFYAVCAGLTALRAPEPIIPGFGNFK